METDRQEERKDNKQQDVNPAAKTPKLASSIQRSTTIQKKSTKKKILA